MTKDQKYKKLSKKLRRAWNLNQQIPVNIFKKQIKVVRNDFQDDIYEVSEEDCIDKKYYFDFQNKNNFKYNQNRERKSKLEARNKIQKTIDERKNRVSSCNGREQVEYKRLIGLKWKVDVSLFPKIQNKDLSSLLSPSINKKILTSLVKNSKIKKKDDLEDDFEYIEFLDFSFKNINKPNFLGHSFEN